MKGGISNDVTLFEQFSKVHPDDFDVNGSISTALLNDLESQLNQSMHMLSLDPKKNLT